MFPYIAEYRAGVVTDGLPGNGTAANFTCDISNYLVGLHSSGEAFLGPPATVPFASGDDSATGTMDNVPAARGSVYTLPACGFAVVGKLFKGWQVGSSTGNLKQPGDTFTVSGNTTVNAVWEDDPTTVVVSFDACGGTVEPAKAAIEVGAAIGALPTPERAGWVFLGWFTEPAETAFVAGEGTPVTAETTFDEDATVYAHWRLPGDINGDGSVNNKDLTRLQRYLKGAEVEVVVQNQDVNGDGGVSNKDLTRLQRWLKGANVEIH